MARPAGLWQHTFDRDLKNHFWLANDQFVKVMATSNHLENQSRVVSFSRSFITCHGDFLCIDNNDVIAGINMPECILLYAYHVNGSDFVCQTT